jgi:hypothetical protein
MKKIAIALLVSVLVASFAVTSQAKQPEAAESDYGSCYSVRPICVGYGTAPVCMCNQSMQCFWACR